MILNKIRINEKASRNIMFVLVIVATGFTSCKNGENKNEIKNETASEGGAVANNSAQDKASISSTLATAPAESNNAQEQEISRFATDSIPMKTENGKPARYGVASAEIEFEYSGNVRGTRKIMFDNYGQREMKIEHSAPNPETAKGRIQNYTMLTTLDTFGVTDDMAKQGWIQKNNLDDEYLRSDSAKTMSFGAYVIARANGKVLKQDKVWEKDCAVFQREQNGVISTIWIWRGIIMKETYSSKQDSISYELKPKKINFGAKFQDSDFKLSTEYEMQDLIKNPPKKMGN